MISNLHLCTSCLDISQKVGSLVCQFWFEGGFWQVVIVPAREEDSQTKQQLNEKSAKLLADCTPLLALQSEVASGESGLSTGVKERSREHGIWGTSS